MFHSVTTMFTDIKQLEQIHVYIHTRVVSQCDHIIHRQIFFRTDSHVHTYQSCFTVSSKCTYIPELFHSVTTIFTDIKLELIHMYIHTYQSCFTV